MSNNDPELEFSQKYDSHHALEYFTKHRYTFRRRLSNWRDHHVNRKALKIAGNPKSVLDMPCGTGRFWDVLAEDQDRIIHASDYKPRYDRYGIKVSGKGPCASG